MYIKRNGVGQARRKRVVVERLGELQHLSPIRIRGRSWSSSLRTEYWEACQHSSSGFNSRSNPDSLRDGDLRPVAVPHIR